MGTKALQFLVFRQPRALGCRVSPEFWSTISFHLALWIDRTFVCDEPGLGSMFVGGGVYRVHGRSVLAGLGVRLSAFKVVSNFIFVLDVPKVSVGLADFSLW